MAWFSKGKDAPTAPAAPKKSGDLDGAAFLALVRQEMDSAGLKYRSGTAGKLQYIELSFSGDNTSVIIRVITEVVLRLFNIVDDAYPETMKAIWS